MDYFIEQKFWFQFDKIIVQGDENYCAGWQKCNAIAYKIWL